MRAPAWLPVSLSVLVASFAAVASAEPASAKPAAEQATADLDALLAPAALKAEKFVLENGLEVILHEDHRLPRVAVNLWYRVGPSNEPKGRSGFAHLFEHLMFEGSKHVGRAFDELLESAGATNVNGTTSWDRTNYFETLPAEQLELGLWLESDRMGFMVDSITQERLDVQREIVRNERRQTYENTPYGKSYLATINGLFPKGHPFHDAVIGSHRDLEAATLEDVRAFSRAFYSPSNATLTLVGALDPASARKLVEKYFSGLPAARPLPRLSPPCTLVKAKGCRTGYSQREFAARHLEVQEAVSLPQVAFAWLTPPAFFDEDLALDLAMIILAQGKTSRLYRALVVEQQVASQVGAWVDSTSLESMAQVSAIAASGVEAARLHAAMEAVLAEFAKRGPTLEEVERARRKLLLGTLSELQYLNSRGGDGGKAGTLQRVNFYLGDPSYLSAWLKRMLLISPEAIHQAASKHLKSERRLSVHTLAREQPKDGKEGDAP